MHTKIKTEFDALEKTRLALFSKLDKVDAAKMNVQPNAKSWSVVQVMDHLIIAETNSLRYMKKKLSVNAEMKKADYKTKIRLFILKAALILPLKYKAPKIVADAKNDKNYAESKAAWSEVRNDMNDFLEKFPEALLDSELFKHPLAGKFTVVQAINFMRTHLEHHLKQVDRILKSLD